MTCLIALSVKSEYIPGSIDLATLKADYYTTAKIESVGVATCLGFAADAPITTTSHTDVSELSTVLSALVDRHSEVIFIVHTDFPMRMLEGAWGMPNVRTFDISHAAHGVFGFRRASLPYLAEVFKVPTADRPNVDLATGNHTADQIGTLATYDARTILRIAVAMENQDPDAMASTLDAATYHKKA
jgi:hypothetical protein